MVFKVCGLVKLIYLLSLLSVKQKLGDNDEEKRK